MDTKLVVKWLPAMFSSMFFCTFLDIDDNVNIGFCKHKYIRILYVSIFFYDRTYLYHHRLLYVFYFPYFIHLDDSM